MGELTSCRKCCFNIPDHLLVNFCIYEAELIDGCMDDSAEDIEDLSPGVEVAVDS